MGLRSASACAESCPVLRPTHTARSRLHAGVAKVVRVAEHWWGGDVAPLEGLAGGGAFDLVLACGGCSMLCGKREVWWVGRWVGGCTTTQHHYALTTLAHPTANALHQTLFLIVCPFLPWTATPLSDVMYVEEAIPALVSSLAALCGGKYNPPPEQEQEQAAATSRRRMSEAQGGEDNERAATDGAASASVNDGRRPGVCTGGASGGAGGVGSPETGPRHGRGPTVVLMAHGRNRFAEAAFWRHAAAADLVAERVPGSELDPVYQCSDVDVFRLRLGRRANGESGSGRKEVEIEEEGV